MKKVLLAICIVWFVFGCNENGMEDTAGGPPAIPLPKLATTAEMQSGTETSRRTVSPALIKSAIDALGGGGVDEIVYQADCSIITNGFCIDTDDGKLYFYNNSAVDEVTIHDAVTLDATIDSNLLSLSTQALGLDTQTANTIFSGPSSGGAVAPGFRALVDADIPNNVTVDSSVYGHFTATSGQQLKLTNTTGVDYADFTVDANGRLTISPSGGRILLGSVAEEFTTVSSPLKITNLNDALILTTSAPTSGVTGRALFLGQIGNSAFNAVLYSSGTLGLGNGVDARDAFIGRSAANTFKLGTAYDLSGDANLELGGKLSIITDSSNLEIGASGDLKLYHDGTDSYVHNSTGNLYFRDPNTNSGTPVTLTELFTSSIAGADTQVIFNDGGSAYGGSSLLTFNKTSGVLSANGFYVPPTAYGPQFTYFAEDSDNGSSIVGIGSPASNNNELILLLPTSDPTANQALVFGVPSSVTFSDNVARDATQATWSDVLTTAAIDTSAELLAILTDETGTGALVFADGNVGDATATTQSSTDDDTSVATTAFVHDVADASQSGTHSTPSTTNPLAPTWTGPMHSVWYGATGEIDLPAAAGYTGRGIMIYNTGAFTITVDPNASEVIVRDGTVQTGGVSFTLSSGAGNYVSLFCDGARWVTLGYKGTLAVGS